MRKLTKVFLTMAVMVVMVGLLSSNALAVSGIATTAIKATTTAKTLKQKNIYATITSVNYDKNSTRTIGTGTAYSPIYGNIALDLTDYYVTCDDIIIITGYELKNNYFYVIDFDLYYDSTIKTFTASTTANRIYMTLNNGLKVELMKIPSLWTKKVLSTNIKLLKYFNGKELQNFNYDAYEFCGIKINGINYIDLIDMRFGTSLNRASYKD